MRRLLPVVDERIHDGLPEALDHDSHDIRRRLGWTETTISRRSLALVLFKIVDILLWRLPRTQSPWVYEIQCPTPGLANLAS